MDVLELGKEAERLLTWIAGYGKDENGGVSRLPYSPEWLDAQQAIKQYLQDEGFEASFDAVGNLFARLSGAKYPQETILTGSHIDTVRNGGIYDGQYGIVSGIIAMRYLQQKYGTPLRNIEVVSIAEEEGSRFPYAFWGSKNILGVAKREDVEHIKDFDGNSFVEAMQSAGFRFRNAGDVLRDDLKAFVELHIEQGGVLEKEGKSVGVVEHIVGLRRFTIEIIGEANHAGTTPMLDRKDAMYVSALAIAHIVETAKKYGAPLVATVGKIELEPSFANVVAGKAKFTLDTRHTNQEMLVKFSEQILADIKRIAQDNGVGINIDMWMDTPPVPMDQNIVKLLEDKCIQNNLNYKVMHSGAGHDSQIMATAVPTAMLFVPSQKGISHSPLEYTAPEYLGEGIKVLIEVLYELAYK